MLYGYLAEAEIALGDYAEAERAAQWMLKHAAEQRARPAARRHAAATLR